MKTPTSLRTPPTVLALAAAALAVVALIVAVVSLQGSAAADPAPTGAAECAPIRVAPAEGTTTAASMTVAVAAVRLAAPGREVITLPLDRVQSADVAVESEGGPGAYYVPTPLILRVDGKGSIPHSDVLTLPAMLDGHLPACGGGA